jgi:DNA-binding response OmpR family regulator
MPQGVRIIPSVPDDLAAEPAVHLVAVSGGGLDRLRTVLALSGFQMAVLAVVPLPGFDLSASSSAPPVVPAVPTEPLHVGDLVVDRARHEARVGERLVTCTPTEFEVLERLAMHPGLVLTRSQLLEHVHGGSRFRNVRTIDSHVRNLRRKLGAGTAPRIVTVFGVGYKLVAPETETAAATRSGISAGTLLSSAPHSASER